MTRFRLVSLCLVALLCLSVAAPAMANPPYITPSGLADTMTDALERLLAWILGEAPAMGPEIVTAG